MLASSWASLFLSDSSTSSRVRPAQTIFPALGKIPGVRNMEPEQAGEFVRLRLLADSGADIREQVFQLVAQNGWTLRELRAERPALEEIFVRLTTKEE